MNKYKWNYSELRTNMIVLREVAKRIEDEQIKKNIEVMANLYESMLALANKKNQKYDIFDESFKNLNINDLINEVKFSYTRDKLQLLNILLNTFIPIKENMIINDSPNDKVIATNEYLVSITEDFFNKMTPPKIKQEFDKAMVDHSFLNFSYSTDHSDYAGVTFFDNFLNKKYVSVSRTNHLSDLIILPHEMFHYIFNDCDAGITCEYNTYYLTEVEGGFANILFGEYFYNQANYNNLFFTKLYMDNFQEQIEDLAIRNQLLDSLKNNNHIRINKLNKFMNYYGLAPFEYKEELESYLDQPQDVIMKYSLSYLAAIDLYYIYKKDPEEAFYLLQNIRYFKRENDIINLLRRNNITFMDDDYNNLKKYVKEIKLKEKSKC